VCVYVIGYDDDKAQGPLHLPHSFIFLVPSTTTVIIIMSGTTLYGNFHNYYKFNAVEERLRCITEGSQCLRCIAQEHMGASEPFTMLDLGCNEGDVSLAMIAIMRELLRSQRQAPLDPSNSIVAEPVIRASGIDLDGELISRAVNKNTRPEELSFEVVDLTNELAFRTYVQSFLGSC